MLSTRVHPPLPTKNVIIICEIRIFILFWVYLLTLSVIFCNI